jgi:hypothetical protein
VSKRPGAECALIVVAMLLALWAALAVMAEAAR